MSLHVFFSPALIIAVQRLLGLHCFLSSQAVAIWSHPTTIKKKSEVKLCNKFHRDILNKYYIG